MVHCVPSFSVLMVFLMQRFSLFSALHLRYITFFRLGCCLFDHILLCFCNSTFFMERSLYAALIHYYDTPLITPTNPFNYSLIPRVARKQKQYLYSQLSPQYVKDRSFTRLPLDLTLLHRGPFNVLPLQFVPFILVWAPLNLEPLN